MFQKDVLLSKYSNYKIGGKAKYFYKAKSVRDLIKAVNFAKTSGIKIFILGGGTNLVMDDAGFDGLVLKPELTKISSKGNKVNVGAGASMVTLLEFCIKKGLSGLEWAGGLPGTFGGAVRGNAGAFRGEIKDAIFEVVSLDINGAKPKVVKRSNLKCNFGYRNSIFKEHDGKEIILSAVLNLKKGDKKEIREAIEEKIKYRLERHPMEYPNIGSIFKNIPLTRIVADLNADITQINNDIIRINPRGNRGESAFTAPIKMDPFPVIPAAYLISESGLKGVSFGGAMVSPKHPNFIVNVLSAKSEDVKNLINLVKETVKSKFELELEEEVIYV